MLLPDGLDRPALPTVQTRREHDAMDLPVMPPVSPMLSKSVASLPPDDANRRSARPSGSPEKSSGAALI